MDFVVDLDTMVPPIKTDYDIPGTLPLKSIILNRKELRNDFIHKKAEGKMNFTLSESENVDKLDNKGCFHMEDENFNLIFLSNMSDPDCDDEII